MSTAKGGPIPSTFPFFLGTNGSGTTLHRAIFDSHPDLAIPGESHFIVKLVRRRGIYEATSRFDAKVFLGDLERESRFAKWGLPLSEVRASLVSQPVEDYPEAIRRLYQLYADRQGKQRYGDKTQAYIHHIPTLAELFPEARFVHAVRDGRNVTLAHTDGQEVERVALSWKRRIMAGREAGIALGKERYLESRFEDLLEDTEAAVRRICSFIDLDYDAEMLTYYERADEVVATTAVPDRHRDIFLPPTKGLQDWHTQLTERQVASFETIAGRALDELGYQRSLGRIPVLARLGAWGSLAVDVGVLGMKRLGRRFK